MNRKIIFITGAVVIILVLGYFLYRSRTQQSISPSLTPSSSATQPPNKQTLTPLTTDKTTNWKTYRNNKYGFEFKYPTEWNLKANSTPGYGGLGISISTDELEIDIDIGSDSGKKLGGGFCEEEDGACSNRTTLSGIHYARIIKLGMLSAVTTGQSRFLEVYMHAPNAFLQFSTAIVNEDGTPLHNVDRAVEVFDQILSTFKFIQ